MHGIGVPRRRRGSGGVRLGFSAFGGVVICAVVAIVLSPVSSTTSAANSAESIPFPVQATMVKVASGSSYDSYTLRIKNISKQTWGTVLVQQMLGDKAGGIVHVFHNVKPGVLVSFNFVETGRYACVDDLVTVPGIAGANGVLICRSGSSKEPKPSPVEVSWTGQDVTGTSGGPSTEKAVITNRTVKELQNLTVRAIDANTDKPRGASLAPAFNVSPGGTWSGTENDTEGTGPAGVLSCAGIAVFVPGYTEYYGAYDCDEIF